MNLLCPNCRAEIDAQDLSCQNNHKFKYDDGVLILLEQNFAQKLSSYLNEFSQIRRSKWDGYLKPKDYPLLPYGDAVTGNVEWRLRQLDLEIILSLLRNRAGQSVLEIGPFNGWLTHRMAKLDLDITAIDYFIDDLDGLKTKKYYDGDWKSIQMDIRDLSIIDAQFDIILVNRCLQFFENPVEYFIGLKRKLNDNGIIILTGLLFFKNPIQKIKRLEKDKLDYIHKYNLSFIFVPFKGYLDFEDKQKLSSNNMELRHYLKLYKANLIALLNPTLPRHYYGTYRKK